MTDLDEDRTQSELRDLLAAARAGELESREFTARLESLHERLLGDGASTPEMTERRRAASKVYDELSAGMDRHHDLERLAQALGIEPR